MIIFPAIDIRGGRCVRLTKGDFSRETVFSDQPQEMAKKWENMGAKYLHVVDLDGALTGESVNLLAIQEILRNVSIPVQLGGGIRTLEDIERFLSMGVRRVILGSVAVRNPELVEQACKSFGEQVVVGIDAKDGIVAVEGWGVSGNVKAPELALSMGRAGVRHIIYTDISRDGTLSGVNIDATIQMAEYSKVKIIASGGVRSMEDIIKVKQAEGAGVEGVIVGKAIYTGSLNLQEALRAAEEE